MLSGSSGASYMVSRAGVDVDAFERLAGDALHAAGIAAEQQADFVVGTVALVDADFLSFALRKVDQFGRHGQPGGLLQQRAELAAQRAARNVRPAEGVLDDGIIGAADFERAFAGADVQAGLAIQVAFENQFSNES